MSDVGERLSSDEQAQVGTALLRQLFVLLRMSRTHDANNAAWGPALAALREVVEQEQGVTLRLGDNVLYLAGERIRVAREAVAAESGLIAAFADFNLGELTLDADYQEEALKALLSVWGGAVDDPEIGFATLEDALSDTSGIHLAEGNHSGDSSAPNSLEAAKTIYSCTMDAVQEVMESVKISQAMPLRRAKRVMHRMVDQLLTDPANLMGLTTLRCYDEYTYHHSVNVCVLSLSIGRKMGVPKPMLAQLGLSSVFHDVGKSWVPLEVLNKAGEFTDDEWQLIREHPVQGVKTLLRLKGMDELSSRVVTGSFEHHMNYDHSGYPRLAKPRNMSLYGRIISLADCYDAMTSSRVYNRVPITPEKALRFMLNKAGSAFDPVLTKVFANAIGIYPVGTLLLLTSGELAVVVSAHDDPTLADRPVVRLISDDQGRHLHDTADVSLDDTASGTTRYVRSIERVLDANAYNIDVSRYFL